MSRRKQRVSYELDNGGVQQLSEEEIRAILAAADPVVGRGGRNMLVKVLKGSREKKILEYQLDSCPSYGCFSDLSLEAIGFRVDWMIQNDYLDIFYSGRLPLLCYTDKGWEIERERDAHGLVQEMIQEVRSGKTALLDTITDWNREVRLLALDLIEKDRETAVLPFLEAWKEREVKKIRARISQVMDALQETQAKGRRLAILFPGLGYTCDKPLLYYAGKLAQKHGYLLRPLSYTDLPSNAKKDPSALAEAVFKATSQTFAVLDSIDWSSYDHVLLISKSIGTQIACAYLEARNLSAASILLTPLEETFRYNAPADLAFHGTNDPWAPNSDEIRKACASRGIRLIEIEGANHSLETGDIDQDIRQLGSIMQEISLLMDRLP